MTTAQWRTLVDHVHSIPERIYEHWVSGEGWDNHTQFGAEYGWDGVSWCMEFDWDMFHDVGLDAIVPKTASVDVMAEWAKARGQWSEYPSIGALVDFGAGAHTEIVIGFDATTVYTKGGNSLATGAVDNGQGNGVWSHSHSRTDSYISGYLAPRFPDGVCPPTADPADPRGGHAVATWRWSAPVTPGKPIVSLARLVAAAHKDPTAAQGHATYPADVKPVEAALHAEGYLAAAYASDGSYGSLTLAAYAKWQKAYSAAHHLGWTGADVNGIPGKTSLVALGNAHGFTVST